jgi:xanthine dehydrogenase YagT iron-sulfur-binding subunit
VLGCEPAPRGRIRVIRLADHLVGIASMPTLHSPVILHINGAEYALALEPRRTLLDALRHDLQLTGTKKVCDMGDCGACTVLVDGRAMYACLLLAVDCEGRQITTIEGLTRDGQLDAV